MSTSRLFSLLDKALPDEKIIQDFSDRIWNDKELYFEIPNGFYKVMVAIGGNYKSGTWIFDSKILFCNPLLQ